MLFFRARSINSLSAVAQLYKNLLVLMCFREGRSNAHIKGDYQRIGDVMLKNFQGLKVYVKLLHVANYRSLLTLSFTLCDRITTSVHSP